MNTENTISMYERACSNGDVDTVTYMIKNETKKFKNDRMLESFLYHACINGRKNIAEIILDYRNILSDRIYDNHSITHVLRYAVFSGNKELVDLIET